MCEFESVNVRFDRLSYDEFRISWDEQDWLARRFEGGFALISELDPQPINLYAGSNWIHLGPGRRISWAGTGSNVYLRWEGGGAILHSADVWRDSDLKAGVDACVVLDDALDARLAPVLLALPLLIKELPVEGISVSP